MNETNEKERRERAIARLRDSKQRYIKDLRGAAEAAGREYLLDSDDFKNLERLQRWRNQFGANFEAVMVKDRFSCREVAAIMTSNDGSEYDIESRLREHHGDIIDDPAWLVSFVEGVLSEFGEISDQI